MPDYSTPFTSGFSVGASAGHMRAMQMERMMELRAQEAQRAVQERMLNAQAAMLTQHAKYYEQQARMEQQKVIKQNALAQAIGDQYDAKYKETGDQDEALRSIIPVAAKVDPDAAFKLSEIYTRTQKEKQFTPQVIQPTDTTTGQPAVDPLTDEPIKMVTTGRGSAVQLDKPTGLFQQLNLVNSAKVKAMERGDQAAIKKWTAAEAKLIESNQISVKFDDQGHIIEFTQGPAGTGLQKSTTAEIEKKMAAAETSLSLINEMLPDIKPTTVGPIGAAKEQIETAANILRPDSMAPEATEAREKFRVAAQQQYSSLKADSQINKLEAEAMKDIVDITKVNMSSTTGKRKYMTLRDLTALQLVLRAHEIGKEAPDSALKSMSLGQASRAWKRGDLTTKEVNRWNDLNGVVK